MEKSLFIGGRVLIALYFLLPGVMKFVAWDTHIALMEKHGMVLIPLLLAIAGITQIMGALLLVVNRYTAYVSLMFVVMIILINVNLHDFWNYTGIEGKHELQNFVKNLGILAGLLVLSAHTWKNNK